MPIASSYPEATVDSNTMVLGTNAAGDLKRFNMTKTLITTYTDDTTLALADYGKTVEINAATAKTVTVPPNASVAFPVGTTIDIVRLGAGAVTIVAGAGVTLRSRSALLGLAAQYSAASLYKRATNEWVVVGDLA